MAGQSDEPSRKDYLLDAATDVAITFLFAVASYVTYALDEALHHHQSDAVKFTVFVLEWSFALAAFDHLLRVLWKRTFVGEIVKASLKQARAWVQRWRANRKSEPPKPPKPPRTGFRSGTSRVRASGAPDGSAIDGSAQYVTNGFGVRTALLLPLPDHKSRRAAASLLAGVIGALLFGVLKPSGFVLSGDESVAEFLRYFVVIVGVPFELVFREGPRALRSFYAKPGSGDAESE